MNELKLVGLKTLNAIGDAIDLWVNPAQVESVTPNGWRESILTLHTGAKFYIPIPPAELVVTLGVQPKSTETH